MVRWALVVVVAVALLVELEVWELEVVALVVEVTLEVVLVLVLVLVVTVLVTVLVVRFGVLEDFAVVAVLRVVLLVDVVPRWIELDGEAVAVAGTLEVVGYHGAQDDLEPEEISAELDVLLPPL